MKLEQYSKEALRTESVVGDVNVDKEQLIHLLQMVVHVTNVLDMVKKKVFYGKEFTNDKITNECYEINNVMQKLLADKNLFNQSEPNSSKINLDPRIFHSIIGSITEAGELGEALIKALETDDFDLANVREEIVDVCWYFAVFFDAAGLSWEEGLGNNIDKLRSRYPEKFTNEKANNRDLQTEREILERDL